MANDFERFGRGHPFLPAGWGPVSRADIPTNAPQLSDVNPAAGIVSRLTARFGGDGGKGRAAGDGQDGEDGLNGSDGLGTDGTDGQGSAGGLGAAGRDGTTRTRLASMQALLAANGISWSAMNAGTSLLNRIANITGEGVCNDDGTITITLSIPP